MTSFLCRVNPSYRDVCMKLPQYRHTGFCVLHYHARSKRGFRQVVDEKLKLRNYNFRGTVFPEGTSTFRVRKFDANADFRDTTFHGVANFSGAEFSGEITDFSAAKFSGTSSLFSRAKFSGGETRFIDARFSGKETDFSNAEFYGDTTDFSQANFGSSEKSDFSDTKFNSVWTQFREAKFCSESTQFTGVTFEQTVHFNNAEFRAQAVFRNATFNGEAHFSEKVSFKGSANFGNATFNNEVHLPEVRFEKSVKFDGATFKEKAAFYDLQTGVDTTLDFRKTTIEKPERISFHNTRLRPSWFVDVDAQKFDFANVAWFQFFRGGKLSLNDEMRTLNEIKSIEGRPKTGDKPETKGEEVPLRDEIRRQSLRELARAYRRLMNNAEENRDYPTANEFHYWSMEAQRKEAAFSQFAPWRLTWWYWALSGYSERPAGAAVWLLFILLGFAGFYMLKGPQGVQELSPTDVLSPAWQSVVYSLGVMTRLRGAVPIAEDASIRAAAILEGVLGPFQIALLALALRRKFMR